MKIGRFDLMVSSSVVDDEFIFEISKNRQGMEYSAFSFCTVRIKNGTPVIKIDPNLDHEHGSWEIEYEEFQQLIAKIDEFLKAYGSEVN